MITRIKFNSANLVQFKVQPFKSIFFFTESHHFTALNQPILTLSRETDKICIYTLFFDRTSRLLAFNNDQLTL